MSITLAKGTGLPRGSGPLVTGRFPVVDTDSHITEPAGVWADRMPSKYHHLMPRVVRSKGGRDMWIIGEQVIAPAWASAPAGWKDYWPSHARTIDEVNPAAYEVHARARHLDQVGIASQVIYPNILSFNVQDILRIGDAQFHLLTVQAYNDFLAEFAAAAPGRFIPIMFLPFWDLEASLREITRCAKAGHKGILFAATPEVIGLPRLRDKHWDPLFKLAEDLGLPINFHIGFAKHGTDEKRQATSRKGRGTDTSGVESLEEARQRTIDFRTGEVAKVVSMMGQADVIGEVILSGMCARYPKLNFVSVESGMGYIPYYLDALDWQWLNSGSAEILPERLMPSEYFARQVYATFWFEHRTVLRLLDLIEDNVMFESDFPHPTCLAPGPVSFTDSPNKVIQHNLASLSDSQLSKVLYANAARVYNLDDSYLKIVAEKLQAA